MKPRRNPVAVFLVHGVNWLRVAEFAFWIILATVGLPIAVTLAVLGQPHAGG